MDACGRRKNALVVDANMLQDEKMQSCGISILNETKQTKRTNRETQTSLCVFDAPYLYLIFILQLRFAASVSFDGYSFVKMTCRRVLAKPRRLVLLQDNCIYVSG